MSSYMFGATTFDPGSGRVLRLTSQGSFWTFDVCTNTWASEPMPEGIDHPVSEFVYDVDSDRFIAFAASDERVAQVWTYEPGTQTWTEKNEWAGPPPPEGTGFPYFQAVYDPVSGLVVVREHVTSAMWTYDVDTDTWTEIDQGTTLPPPAVVFRPFEEGDISGVGYNFAQALTYDASVDRLILYDERSTWEFDIRAGQWEEQDAIVPDPGSCAWSGPGGDEFTFDEANEVSVLFGGGPLATYDASEHTWTVLQHGSNSPDAAFGERFRICYTMTYDSVNERIVVLGGDVRNLPGERRETDPERDGWYTRDEVIAYDVATGEWITLLEPTSG
jgi:hypothetical protein